MKLRNKILQFLGFRKCNICGKIYHIKQGNLLRFTDDGEDYYYAFCCKQCWLNISED
jgi:hypothetical protein